jgi:hypothetical protein
MFNLGILAIKYMIVINDQYRQKQKSHSLEWLFC